MLSYTSIRTKLFLTVLAVVVPSLILIGALGYVSGRAAVERITLGAGLTFTIELPAKVHALEAARATSRAQTETSGTIPEGVRPILVIDDVADSRERLQRTFERDGHVVVTAAGGEEGLETARRVRPAFITLDIMMPGVDGWAVFKALKQDPELAGGVERIVQKGALTRQELLFRVRSLVERHCSPNRDSTAGDDSSV